MIANINCCNISTAPIAQPGERQSEHLNVPGLIPILGKEHFRMLSLVGTSPLMHQLANPFAQLMHHGACVYLARPRLGPKSPNSGANAESARPASRLRLLLECAFIRLSFGLSA